MTISQAARRVGLKPSAIRYYEQIGILPSAQRAGGQRRYDETVLHRLALIQRARQMGFSLEDVRQLFFGFRNVTTPSQRWRALSRRKLADLEALAESVRQMQELLLRMTNRCRCETLAVCGERVFRSYCETKAGPPRNPQRHAPRRPCLH